MENPEAHVLKYSCSLLSCSRFRNKTINVLRSQECFRCKHGFTCFTVYHCLKANKFPFSSAIPTDGRFYYRLFLLRHYLYLLLVEDFSDLSIKGEFTSFFSCTNIPSKFIASICYQESTAPLCPKLKSFNFSQCLPNYK